MVIRDRHSACRRGQKGQRNRSFVGMPTDLFAICLVEALVLAVQVDKSVHFSVVPQHHAHDLLSW